MLARRLCTGLFLVLALPAAAQLDNLDEQLRTTPITTREVAPDFHVLFGVGGNIIVSIGANGVLIATRVEREDRGFLDRPSWMLATTYGLLAFFIVRYGVQNASAFIYFQF